MPYWGGKQYRVRTSGETASPESSALAERLGSHRKYCLFDRDILHYHYAILGDAYYDTGTFVQFLIGKKSCLIGFPINIPNEIPPLFGAPLPPGTVSQLGAEHFILKLSDFQCLIT